MEGRGHAAPQTILHLLGGDVELVGVDETGDDDYDTTRIAA